MCQEHRTYPGLLGPGPRGVDRLWGAGVVPHSSSRLQAWLRADSKSLFTWHFGTPGIKSKIIEGSKTEIISQERPAGESRGWKTK
ncbi:probable G-protein coupled receptor 160 isoform X2 [Canis lupus familiaris]|uniref:probable G-protein coupled receptor 160 isoform X2 n=1 Tax=Canis lupus familiaris TaxID=9615 RepID=UPI000DC6B01E|nr:probable G-protein coupled receptor 160 isoform X2 [Canis lupus familiaris]XP_038318785.1 probable G-protein coupled receptor 160 isoform X2 [Canis lupus familiaris]